MEQHLSYIFIFLAAICNAFMDIVENENFFESRFKNLNEKFWYKRISWEYAEKLWDFKVDAWHIAKSLMIVFLCAAIVNYQPFIPIVDFIVLGGIWNLTFNLFYNRIFKSKL